MSLKDIHRHYRVAVETARDPEVSAETRDRAADDATALRLRLDEGLINQRRDEEIAESRSSMDHIIRPVGERTPGYNVPINGPSEADVRSWLDPASQERALHMNWSTRADAIWWKDTSVGTVMAGNMVPTSVLGRIVYHINAQSGVFEDAYKLPTATGEDITVPTLTTDASAGQTAEKVAATLTSPVIGTEVLKSYRQDGYFVLSDELIRDAATDVNRIVGDIAGRAIATQVATLLATGTGSGEPEGVTVGCPTGKVAASKVVFTYDELTDLYLSIPAQARAAGTWHVGSTAFATIFKMKDADGRPYMQAAPAAGMADTLMGKPIRECAAFPAQTTGLRPVVFGDVANYYWVRLVDRASNGGILLEFDGSPLFTAFSQTVRFAVWLDARVMGTGGEIAALQMS